MRRISVAGAAMLAATLLSPLSACAAPSALSRPRLVWSQLHFEASRALATLTLDIDLNTVAPAAVAAAAQHRSLPAFSEPDAAVTQLHARFAIDSLLRDYRVEERLWFADDDQRVLSREKRLVGDDGFVKQFRYTADAAHRLHLWRREGDAADPVDAWTGHRLKRYPYGQARADCDTVSEPAVLFYLLAQHDFGDGRAVERCVFSDSALFRMRIEPVGEATVDAALWLGANNSGVRVEQPRRALRLRVSATPLPGAADDAEFEVFDFKGRLDLLVDRQWRLPLRLEGDLPGVGRGAVELTSARIH